MAELVPGKPLAQKSPDLLVENRLKVGRWRFRLTVVDGAGNESRPAELVVQVADAPAPLPLPILLNWKEISALPGARKSDRLGRLPETHKARPNLATPRSPTCTEQPEWLSPSFSPRV